MSDYPTPWVLFDRTHFRDHPDLFAGYLKCFNVKTGSGQNILSLAGVYSSISSYNLLNVFGEKIYVSQVKPWNGRPAKREPDESSHEMVAITQLYRDGSKKSMTRESRSVYRNGKGRYIKIKGRGRIYMGEDNKVTIRA